jgi:S-DNA-T family DNA segregation ATPase FtsK/SpoIIIE
MAGAKAPARATRKSVPREQPAPRKAATRARVTGKTAVQAPAARRVVGRAAPRRDQRRDIIALVLITIAIVTVVFWLTGASGVLGGGWVAGSQWLLGWGALIVPLALGVLGGAILWHERHEDLRLGGATIVGTLLTLLALLTILEFPVQDQLIGVGEPDGGGVIGATLLEIGSRAIGRPASLFVAIAVGITGLMLTFDISLREVLAALRSVLPGWRAPRTADDDDDADDRDDTPQPVTLTPARRREPAARRAADAASAPAAAAPAPATTPPATQDADLIATPIAERIAPASLFRRPEAAAAGAQPPAVAAPAKPAPAAQQLLGELLSKSAVAPATLDVPVQHTLDLDEPPIAAGASGASGAWQLPGSDLLDVSVAVVASDDDRRIKARLIEETLASFKVEAQIVGVNVGPAITQFELQPAVGVKVSKITTLERDLALALAASSIRIEAPIPGKAVVGIEIPNSTTTTVTMRAVVESPQFEQARGRLKFPLGEDVSGLPIVAGLERMPHLLVAGSTGSGKSAGINAIICALLLRHTPETLRFIMVDPKMVELIVYNGIPHMLAPVITELERVVPTLKWATREMERRYKIFARHGFRNIDSYRAAIAQHPEFEPLPYIVIIIDELADLMMMAPDEVETQICRLAQMARATGMHLIIATQRPSVDVVTGLIKANFPSRVAFAVTSQTDSRVILDMNGAEQLLGRGDMLYLGADSSRPQRIQGTWVSEGEVERIVAFWRRTPPPATAAAPEVGAAAPPPRPAEPAGPAEFLGAEERDALLPDAIALVRQHPRASASLLQRRLRIGYSKAAQLIELLEAQGIVGPAGEGRSREVLLRDRPAHDD